MSRRVHFVFGLVALSLACVGLVDLSCAAQSPPYNGEDDSPYRVGTNSPRLVTPQWVGEPGVEAVFILSIDDMTNNVPKYEAFLRPVLDRLKKIDGRAPVSILTCRVDPADPGLQSLLKEGVSFDVHTTQHPCPCLQKGDFAAASKTYHDGVDLVSRIPGNAPVAFRMPCCDSMNSVSPRFFSEIINKKSPAGKFLSVDSSVFTILTPDDPALPKHVAREADGSERFRKYLPVGKTFVNLIENYPYPYPIRRLCWEFPCVVPSDWEAQNLHRPNNPKTTEDLKAALDGVVAKRGVFPFVFHPHGWISAEMIVELIDHAVAKHGGKVKFMTFQEAKARIDRHLLDGGSLRNAEGGDGGVRLTDLDGDGLLDVVIGANGKRSTRVWNDAERKWVDGPFPTDILGEKGADDLRIGRVDGRPTALRLDGPGVGQWSYDAGRWTPAGEAPFDRLPKRGKVVSIRLADVDGDGSDELFVSGPDTNFVATWDRSRRSWSPAYTLPDHASFVDANGADNGVRLIDLDEDGRLDVVVSNERHDEIHLYDTPQIGWARTVPLPETDSHNRRLPPFVKDGTDMGAWFADRHLWMQNEMTSGKPDLVDRRSFNDLLKGVEPRAKTKKAALDSIRVAPGFKVELMASEPLVRDPIAFDWGADGRLWVVEMGDYPLGLDGKMKSGGRVKFLEDLDGDGVYDRATTFVEDLPFPTGVMPWRKGVLISAAPEILYAEDADGDGKAEVRRTILTGFVPGNPQHRVNGFAPGLDGWVYAANGDSGGEIKSVATGKTVSISGRDFRFRPDTGEVEAESGQTQYGRSRDDWGRWFGNNNSVWGWQYVLTESDLARNPAFRFAVSRQGLLIPSRLHPISRLLPRFNVPASANHVTSANSFTPYRDDLFGPAFGSSAFISEPVHNLIRRVDLVPDGPALRGVVPKSEADREFLASSDHWFRPAGMKTGPDGALWIADMHRAVIEHPEWIPDDWEAKLDLRAGHDMGRIYRVVPVGASLRPFERMDRLDVAGLVARIDDPNGWRRDTAQRLLVESGDPTALLLLERLISDSPNPKARLQAFATWGLLSGKSPKVFVRALTDAHPLVRRAAVRRTVMAAKNDASIASAVLALADDSDVGVRFEAALAFGDWDDPRAARALAKIALKDIDQDWTRTAVLTSARPHAAILLGELLAGSGNRPPTKLIEPLFASLRSEAGNEPLERLRETLSKPTPGFADWQFAGVAGLADVGKDGALLGDRKRFAAMRSAAEKIVADETSPEPRRVLALQAFARLESDATRRREAFAGLIGPRVPPELRRTAIAQLGKLDDPKVATTLIDGWKGLTPASRDQALETLLSRPAWTGALLSSLEDTCTPASDISGAYRERLLRHPDATFAGRAKAVFAAAPSTREAVLAAYAKSIERRGDRERGAAVFKKSCANCHRLNGQGTEIGPDLSTVGDKPAEALLVSILDPNRAFEARYASFAVELHDGRLFTGLIAGESANVLTLRKADGKEESIPRAEIAAVVGSGRSLMPEGLENDLKPEDVSDLITFLRSHETPPKRFDGNRPEPVKPNSDGSIRLTAASAEIRGDSLVFEPRYGNLGYWTSANDRAAWTIASAKPGRYRVAIEYARPDDGGAETLVLSAGSEGLAWRAVATGSWDVYKSAAVGEIEIKPGVDRVIVSTESKPKSALIDLKWVELRPIR